jgi:hypothetical protein
MRRIGMVVALTLAVGCGKKSSEPKLADVIAKHEAQIEPKLAAAATIAGEKAPSVGSCDADADPRIVTTGVGGAAPVGNALIVYRTDLADLTKQSAGKYTIPGVGLFQNCAALVRNQELAAPSTVTASGGHAQNYLPGCAGAEFLYVIEERSMTEPAISGSSYTPGKMSGEVHLYRFDGAKHVCGFAFEASTPDSFQTNDSASRSAESDLAGAFMSAIATAIDDGIKKNIPGATVD